MYADVAEFYVRRKTVALTKTFPHHIMVQKPNGKQAGKIRIKFSNHIQNTLFTAPLEKKESSIRKYIVYKCRNYTIV